MDRHTQFLPPPPISSPLPQHSPSSKYTSYDSLQNHIPPNLPSTHHLPTPILLPPVHPPPNIMPMPPSPTTPDPLPLILHMSNPCTNPFPNPGHPSLPHHPLLLPSPSRPRSMSSLALSTLPRTPLYTSPSPMQLTGRRRSRPRPCDCPLAQSAIGGRQSRSREHSQSHQHQHERYTNVHGIGSDSDSGSGGSVQLAESPQIRAEALIPLMALGVLEHAGRCVHMVHRCVCTRVFHPLYGRVQRTCPWLQTWVS